MPVVGAILYGGYQILSGQATDPLGKWTQRVLGTDPKKKYPRVKYAGTYSGTAEPARLVYGTVKIGGMHVTPAFCTGQSGKQLHLTFAIALHECEAISEFWFNDEVILPGDCTAVTGTDDDGKVQSGPYRHKANVRGYRGTATQTVDYILSQQYPAAFTSDFRGRGICYAAIRLWADKEYEGGVPDMTFMVKGRMIYDTRTLAVGTSASTNPALIWRDYMVNEVGFPSTAVDDALVSAAANICDQMVDIPPGATQQKRYECNVMLSAADDWETNAGIILQTMMGKAIYVDGKWRLFAGAWDSPSVPNIQPRDWAREMTVRISAPMEERYNSVSAFYMDATSKYQRTQSFIRRNTTYESDDGERIPLEIEVQGCTNEYHAQRLAEFHLRNSRNQLSISGVLRPEFIKLSTWDTVYLDDPDFGWSAKSFRVARMEMMSDGLISVELREEGSALWTDLARADYNVPTTKVTIDPGATLPDARTGFTITPNPGSLTFKWDVNSYQQLSEETRILEATVSSDAAAATEIWRGPSTGVNLAFSSVSTKAYWIQGVVGSYVGAYTPNTFGTYAAANSAGTGAAGADGVMAALTLPSVTLPASVNGTVANYGPAAGTFEIYKGGINATSYATFDVASNAGLTGTVNSAHGSPWASNSKGAYQVTAVTSAIGVLHMTAVYSGVTYLRQFAVSKAMAGSAGLNASLLSLSATGQVFQYSGSGTNIGVSTIGFDALLQNLSGTAGFRANNYRSDGTMISSYALAGAGNAGRGLHINSFTQNNSTAYCIVTASLSGGYSDQVTVVRLNAGADGVAGTAGLVSFLTNENHTIPASSNGYVPSYPGANGTFVMMWGVNSVNVNSMAYSVPANPQSLTNVFSTNGTYAVTGGLDPGEDQGLLTLRGTFNGSAHDKIFTLSKSVGGSAGTPGADGVTASLTLVNFTIQCDAGGAPKAGAFTNAVGQMTVWAGAVDVTNSCVFTNSRYGLTGSVNSGTNAPVTGAKGSYRATAVDSDISYFNITATFSTKAVTQQVTFNKAYDGAASAYAEDTTFTNVTSTSFGTVGQAGVIEVPVGPNGYVQVSLTGGYKGTGTSGDVTCNAKIQYRDKAVGGAYSDITGAVGSGSLSEYTDSWSIGNVTISATSMAAPTSVKIYEFQAVMYKYGTNSTVVWMGTPKFTAQWRP